MAHLHHNTHSVGQVHDAVVAWVYENRLFDPAAVLLLAEPIVAETFRRALERR